MVTISYGIALVLILAEIDKSFALPRRKVVNQESVSSNLISRNRLQGRTVNSVKLSPLEGLLESYNAPDGNVSHGDRIRGVAMRSAAAYQSCPNYMLLLRIYSKIIKRLAKQKQYMRTLQFQLNHLHSQKIQLQSDYKKCFVSMFPANQKFCQAIHDKLNHKKKEIQDQNKLIKSSMQQIKTISKQRKSSWFRLWRCTNPW